MNSSPLLSMDVSGSTLASYLHDVAAEMDDEIERREVQEFAENHGEFLRNYSVALAVEVISLAFSRLDDRSRQLDDRGKSRARIATVGFMIATGLCGYGENTLAENAAELNCTKQALSKEVMYWRDLFGIRALGACRSDRVRQSLRNHKASQECLSGLGELFSFAEERKAEAPYRQINKALDSVWIKCARVGKAQPVDQWPESVRQSILHRLRPLAELYQEISFSLN
jgi:hypothetical protein